MCITTILNHKPIAADCADHVDVPTSLRIGNAKGFSVRIGVLGANMSDFVLQGGFLMSRSALAEKHPWTLPWWKVDSKNFWVLIYILAIHVLAGIGLILFPLPDWKVFLGAFFLTCAGGLGTTVGYHRGLAHRAVKLHPVIEQVLIF